MTIFFGRGPVFKRDEFTCKYCGRKAPDVELHVDHLVPVSKGGTDDIDNLVTSCVECNLGKSAKDVTNITGGHSKEDWKEVLRTRRTAILQERRTRLPELLEYWGELRGQDTANDYDVSFIEKYVELYEPDKIKEAMDFATSERRENYIKYVGGILKNWALQDTPSVRAIEVAKLDTKKATTKQVDYIAGLLNSLGLDLEDVYFKEDLDDLTQWDAKQLIEELKGRKGR